MNRSIGLFGTAEPSAADQLVVCGRLSLRIRGGELRRVSFDGAEAVRSIAFVIRDRDWGTLALGTTSASLDLKADSFRYDYAARTDGAPVTVSITVTGSGDGQVSIEGEARVEGDFETNRTGFVILHPIEGVAGAPADVVGSDGAPRHGRFPERISPGQPFFDIQEIRHGFAGGGAVHIRFAGEVFEMEDQRNWTDASFKTYCRPLGLPYPYRVEPQHPVRQGIRLTLSAPRTPPPPGGQAVELTLGEDGGETMPELALAFEPGWEPDDWQADRRASPGGPGVAPRRGRSAGRGGARHCRGPRRGGRGVRARNGGRRRGRSGACAGEAGRHVPRGRRGARVGHGPAAGLSEEPPAVGAMADRGRPGAGGGGRAQRLSRGPDRRRHADLFHRVQPLSRHRRGATASPPTPRRPSSMPPMTSR
jgi:hypothetical protein